MIAKISDEKAKVDKKIAKEVLKAKTAEAKVAQEKADAIALAKIEKDAIA